MICEKPIGAKSVDTNNLLTLFTRLYGNKEVLDKVVVIKADHYDWYVGIRISSETWSDRQGGVPIRGPAQCRLRDTLTWSRSTG
jgi:hypothetical protein